MDRIDEILNDCYGELGEPEKELTSKPYRAIREAMEQYSKEWEDKYKEANQFICDLGKLLGQDGLGFDDMKWSIEDFRDTIDEKKKEMCLELLEYMAKNNVSILMSAEKPFFLYENKYLTKEQLFNNFL